MLLPGFSKTSNQLHRSTVEKLLTDQLLWMLFLRVVLYTLILGLSAYLHNKQFNVITLPPAILLFFITLVYASSIVSSFLLLNTTSNVRRFGINQNLLDTLFVSVLVYLTGSSTSIFPPIYFFPIIAGGLILPRSGGLIAAGAATIQFGFVLFLEFYNFFPSFLGIKLPINDKDPMAILNMFTVYGLIFFLAAILSGLFAARLRKTEDALSVSVRDFDQLSILYKQIFDNINTGIITTNEQNRISSVNNATSKITGYSLEDLQNQKFEVFFPDISLSNKGSRHSASIKRKDGELTRIGYSNAKLQNTREKNSALKPDSSICQNCKVITIQDISEVERLEKQMQQNEKLAAIGQMSAGIAHDFRNPLTAISGSAQVLANEINQSYPEQQSNSELINIILRESNRLSNTVSDFLQFAKPEHAEKEWFSLKRCLDEVLEVAGANPVWPQKDIIDFQMNTIVDIWADQYQLFTMLNHLLQNAMAFCPPGNEKICISAYETTGEDNRETIEISVEDNGPGIRPGKEKKIFDPFYTKRIDGTGLGLAIVKQIIKEHHGHITVSKSSLGGAKFTLSFPLPS